METSLIDAIQLAYLVFWSSNQHAATLLGAISIQMHSVGTSIDSPVKQHTQPCSLYCHNKQHKQINRGAGLNTQFLPALTLTHTLTHSH
jgi:hypothetical protein